ncbi:hypothetical protein A3D73_00270 [Candidatus Uhrbacteria bacterium RIFCSPHIGHO2_02_FULL_60_44]|nr:MAG: hypothetical protein A3D73_00270 [Candidatus Uhrbacteria bacterium RIFCSPHIGHO2_02_FULL_60_44]
MEKHPLHIKQPELQTSADVNKAVKRQERLTGKRVPNDPGERIEAYMSRLENVFLHPDKEKRERNIDMLCPKIHDALLVKREDFPESYFELQQRVARERGQPVEVIPEETREQMMDVAIQDQKASLDAWMDYLTEQDVAYPTWFKFFVWKNVIKLSQFDKERGEFKKRTDTTVARFPDIHRGALAQILDVYQKVKADNKNLKEPEIREAFSKKFPTLYAELISKSLAATIENKEEIKGQWVKYDKGDNKGADKLYESMQGKGTGWCVEGKTTAHSYIDQGDFHVYYSNDAKGDPVQPRLAIQLTGSEIGQIRGILPHQEVEPVMQEALDGKLKEFGKEADAYRKKSSDMKRLTAIDVKIQEGQNLTKDDLIFLYEIDSPIQGFGYQKDPRVKELRSERNPEMDILVIFECTRSQIAHVPSEINKHTKAYVGQLEPGIFQKLPEHLEHIYTSFPEKKIRRERIEIGGRTVKQLEQEIADAGMQISDYAKSMLASKEFKTNKIKETVGLIRLTVADLGFKGNATTDQIYKRAEELGLELCPAEVGPQYRLQNTNQPMDEWVYVGMKQIAGPGGDPGVFRVARSAGGTWLNGYWADPTFGWRPDRPLLFRLRKSKT